MQKEPLTIEWQAVEGQDNEARLFEAFKILLNNQNEYEKTREKEEV